ncbi:glycerate kinase [Pseudomonadota bacterium]
MSYRDDLNAIYQAALQSVEGRHSVVAALRDYDTSSPVHVVAIGKAACSMYAGAHDVLSEQISRALVITKEGHVDPALSRARVRFIESGHPWPTQASLDAGASLLKFIKTVPHDGRLLFLISGGASSLVEVLPQGVSLAQLYEVNDWLLGSGFDIHTMNRVRKAISTVKGGRLASYLAGRETLVLLISDVPGDAPATIGSGLLVADSHCDAKPLSDLLAELPEWMTALINDNDLNAQASGEVFDTISVDVIASLADAKHAAAQCAQSLGYDVYEHAAHLGGDAVVVGRKLASELLNGPAGVHVWGGETSVCLPEKPGRGGRNQHLALAAAIELDGCLGAALLVAGTDGTDGPTDDAGALVDGQTVGRAATRGFDPRACLSACDSGSLFEASGDLICTGPTGTNVMDLMIGLKMC